MITEAPLTWSWKYKQAEEIKEANSGVCVLLLLYRYNYIINYNIVIAVLKLKQCWYDQKKCLVLERYAKHWYMKCQICDLREIWCCQSRTVNTDILWIVELNSVEMCQFTSDFQLWKRTSKKKKRCGHYY